MSRDDAFQPRSLTAPEYVRALFEPADNAAILVRNREVGKTIQRIAKVEVIVSPEFQRWLAAESAAGADLYIGMNPIKDGARGRTKDNIKGIRHAYLDLDRSGDESLETIWNSPAVPPPNFVVDTSPGKHQVVWKVTGFNQEEAETLLRHLAREFDGDPAATDSTRVLRLPEFANRKVSEKFIVRARQESEGIHTPCDFARQGSPGGARHFAENREYLRAEAGEHKSQSENDWAYAKRALARGDDPELVIRRIEEYRGSGKHTNYARYTVEKAQSRLQRGTKGRRGTEKNPALTNDHGRE